LSSGRRAKGLWIFKLGFKDYQSVLDLQKRMWEARDRDGLPDSVILVEHDHTITSGAHAGVNNLLLPKEELRSLGISVHGVRRGGDYTYHGPGQLVCYPVMKLEGEARNVVAYVFRLEETMIRTLKDFGIDGGRKSGLPGVWVGQRKIGCVGVAIRRWVTYHGFALNVSTDLSFFKYIRPCGQDWRVMTSMADMLAKEVNMEEVIDKTAYNLCEVFNVTMVEKQYEDIIETALVGS
jgi:lipoate-protein ligase B